MLKIQVEGVKEAQKALSHVASPATQKKVLAVIAKSVMNASKERTRKQTDLSGAAWKPRKDRTVRRRMLIKTGQRIRTISVNPSEALIGFNNRVFERIAASQQRGLDQIYTRQLVAAEEKRKAKKKNGGVEPEEDSQAGKATMRQARALIAAGFKIRGRRGYKTPTFIWIKRNMSLEQAGVILRILRGKPAKSSWVIPLPERSFLGVTAGQLEGLAELAFNEMKPTGQV
jgi:hypothetical protein